jgi:hypothetical protein
MMANYLTNRVIALGRQIKKELSFCGIRPPIGCRLLNNVGCVVRINEDHMNIFPKVGINNIKLGMNQKDVQALLGQPTAKEKTDEEEIWEFEDELELSFQAEDNFRLSSITIMSDTAVLDSRQIIGITESELESIFPEFRLDEDFNKDGKSYYADELQIMAWVFDGEVFNVVIFPEYDENTELPMWPA